MQALTRCRLLALVLGLATACVGPAWAQGANAPGDSRESRAVDALARMGAYLRSLKQFRLRATTTTDEVLDRGQKLQFGAVVDYRVRQPDGLRADLRNDRIQRQFYYDGVSLTQFAPKVGYYATVDAPGTIAAALEEANARYDLELPLADLFLWGTERAGLGQLQEAAFVGASSIGGVAVDHFAYRQSDVDWQIWIAQGAPTAALEARDHHQGRTRPTPVHCHASLGYAGKVRRHGLPLRRAVQREEDRPGYDATGKGLRGGADHAAAACRVPGVPVRVTAAMAWPQATQAAGRSIKNSTRTSVNGSVNAHGQAQAARRGMPTATDRSVDIDVDMDVQGDPGAGPCCRGRG